jgi:hypothetical protein
VHLGSRRLLDVATPIGMFQLQAPDLRTEFPPLWGVDSKSGEFAAAGHPPGRTVEHRADVIPVPQFGVTGRQPRPHRHFSARGDHTVTGTTDTNPSCASIALRSTSSCASRAARIANNHDPCG